jgi:hypothetical protein
VKRSRTYARMRRHALTRPMPRRWWWRGIGEPVPICLARLRRAEIRTNQWRAIMVEVPSPENVEEPK